MSFVTIFELLIRISQAMTTCLKNFEMGFCTVRRSGDSYKYSDDSMLANQGKREDDKERVFVNDNEPEKTPHN